MEKPIAFIGNSRLLIRCIEISINRGYVVKGIVTHDLDVLQWAKLNSLNVFQAINEIKEIDSGTILFSINNDVILESFDLDKFKVCINYHNSKLPEYAGVNAAAWAILEGSCNHGITWHVMERDVDSGCIIYQKEFNIDVDCTTEKLVIKCNDLAEQSFPIVLDLIREYSPIKNRSPLQPVYYYKSNKLPPNLGFIDFKWPLENLGNLLKALHYGSINNPITTAKVFIDKDPYIIEKYYLDGTVYSFAPGTVIDINEHSFKIILESGAIVITSLKNIDGGNVNLEHIFAKQKKTQFLPNTIARLADVWIDAIACESAFRKIFARMPLHEVGIIHRIESDYKYSLKTNKICSFHGGVAIEEQVSLAVSSILILLRKIIKNDNVYIGMSNISFNESLKDYFSNIVPQEYIINDKTNVSELMSVVSKNITTSTILMRDFSYRHPNIESILDKINYIHSIKIIIINDIEELSFSELSLMTFVFCKKHSSLYVSNAVFPKENNINSDIETFNKFISNVAEDARAIAQQLLRMQEEQKGINHIVLPSEQELKTKNIILCKDKLNLPDASLVEEFAISVSLCPQALAICDLGSGKNLSYRQVEIASNKLANYLQSIGIRPSDFVGVYMQNSADAIVAILAILKVRAIYLPVSTRENQDNLAKILSVADAKYVIVGNDSLNIKDVHVINLHLLKFDKLEDKKILLKTKLYDIAYAIQTSGTTGVPKIVPIKHISIVNLLNSLEEIAPVNGFSKHLLWSNINFDVSVYEIFSALCNGGTLYIPEDNKKIDANYYSKIISYHKINSFYIPPYMVKDFTSSLLNKEVPFISRILVGVEPLEHKVLCQLQNKCSSGVVINGYGPSEAAVCSTLSIINTNDSRKGFALIGKNILNTRCWIAGHNQQPVSVGSIGEIYIAGIGLSPGYVGDSNNSNFGYIREQDSRVYKTGDLALLHANGEFEFIGRKDLQVKINGIRVNLIELRNIILIHCRNLVDVFVTKFNAGAKTFIIAYIILEPEANFEDAKQDIENNLPYYAKPSSIIQVNAFPINANGKIDESKLPSHNNINSLQQEDYTSYSKLEIELVDIYSKTLSIDNINKYHDFKILGGDSIDAAKLCLVINEQLGTSLVMKDIFENPTIDMVARKIDVASKNTSSLIDDVSSNSSDGVKNSDFRLLPSQKRLWIINQVIPNSSVYNVPEIFELFGDVNYLALSQSIRDIYSINPCLRAVFKNHNTDGLLHVLDDDEEFSIDEIDFSSKKGKNKKIYQYIGKFIHKDFKLAEGKLFRAAILKIANNRVIVCMSFHHAIIDDWSISLIISQIQQRYKSLSSHKNIAINLNKLKEIHKIPIDINYSYNSSSLNFWKDYLKESSFTTKLPYDYFEGASLSFAGETISFPIPDNVLDYIKLLSDKYDLSLNMIYLAAWALLIQCYTQSERLLIGGNLSYRNSEDINLVSLLSELIVFNIPELSEKTFIEAVIEITRDYDKFQKQKQMPYEELIQHFGKGGQVTDSLFQVMFNFSKRENSFEIGDSIIAKRKNIKTSTAKYHLSMYVNNESNKTSFSIEYRTGLFKRENIRQMGEYYTSLLACVSQSPKYLLKDINFFNNEALFPDYYKNRAEKFLSTQKHVLELFENNVKNHPQAIIMQESDKMTNYLDFSQLVHNTYFLIYDLIEVNTLVIFYAPASTEIIAAMAAVLRKGAYYLCLDTQTPCNRVIQQIVLAEPALIITDTNNMAVLEPIADKYCIFDIEHTSKIGNYSFPKFRAQTDYYKDIAYCISTSGTTGEPKISMITHYTLANLVDWHINRHFSKPKNIGLLSNLAFDVSVQSIYCAICSGSMLTIIPRCYFTDPDRLTDYICEKQISVLFITPTVLQLIADYFSVHRRKIIHLEKLIVSGEPFYVTPTIKFFVNFNEIVVYNQYGPSETHVITEKLVNVNAEDSKIAVGMGYPISNAEIVNVDKHFKPQPFNMKGELLVSGPIILKKYKNNVEDSKFITLDNKTFFRSGDVVRIDNTGDIQFKRRSDLQVKINGIRVEIEEIESSIFSISSDIKQCAVKVSSKDPNQIAAYVCAEKTITEGQIKQSLKNRLPNYMLPSEIIFVTALPITKNGKIDRKNIDSILEQDQYTKRDTSQKFTDLQNKLINIWRSILGTSNIHLSSNFFDLAGSSLFATRMLIRLMQELNVNISFQDFFSNPTIEYLDRVINKQSISLESVSETNKIIHDLNIPLLKNNYLGVLPSGNAILVTGGTGYIGMHLINSLLNVDSDRIYCLVNSVSDQDAKRKFICAADKYKLFKLKNHQKIIVIAGNVALPRLNLQLPLYNTIANGVKYIYHCAAKVNHILPYNKLKHENVYGTYEVIQLALNKQKKHIVYISTLGMKNLSIDVESFINQSSKDNIEKGNGYVQTKIVSELLIRKASLKHNLNATIVRPSFIVGHSTNNYIPSNNQISMIIRGCIEMKCAPINFGTLDLITTDVLSDTVKFLAQVSRKNNLCTYNLIQKNPISWDECFSYLHSCGYNINLVSYDKWVNALRSIEETNPLFPIAALFISGVIKHDIYDKTIDLVDSENTITVENKISSIKLIQQLTKKYPAPNLYKTA